MPLSSLIQNPGDRISESRILEQFPGRYDILDDDFTGLDLITSADTWLSATLRYWSYIIE